MIPLFGNKPELGQGFILTASKDMQGRIFDQKTGLRAGLKQLLKERSGIIPKGQK